MVKNIAVKKISAGLGRYVIMKLKGKNTTNLYTQLSSERRGNLLGAGIPVYKARFRHRGGGVFSLIAGIGKGLIKKALPSIGKRFAREMGPKILKSAVHSGADILRGKKKFKEAVKDVVRENKKELIRKSAEILKSEAKKAIKGGKRKGGRIGRRRRTKLVGVKKKSDIFELI